MLTNLRQLLLLLLCCSSSLLMAQGSVKGVVQDPGNQATIPGVLVEVQGTDFYDQTNVSGVFEIENVPFGEYRLKFTAEGYADFTKEIEIKGGVLDLGTMTLTPAISEENVGAEDLVPTIMLSDEELESGTSGTQTVSGILNARRNTFSSKVAFDFSAARFRIRGYDSDHTSLYMNGIPMNDLASGRPTWWSWSGLNDVTRNRNSQIGLGLTDYSFGDLGGASFIDSRASKQRKQFRVTYTFANRSYNHRLMATYNSGLLKNGWAFSVSGSYRISDGGPWTYIKGATYNAGAYFVGVEKIIGKHSIAFNAFGSPNVRGKGAPAVQEMFDLSGNNYYNPNWGYQTSAETGKRQVRNAKTTDSHQPLFLLTHEYKPSDKFSLMTSASYQFGKYSSTALDWYAAQDPRPDYYRKLPSYIEDEAQSQIAYDMLSQNEGMRQIQWDKLYEINRNAYDYVANANGSGDTLWGNRARYILEDRHYNSQKANGSVILNAKPLDILSITGGISYEFFNGHNFKAVEDLLGADFYVDINRFVERDSASTENTDVYQNDVNNPNRILKVGDKFGYDYESIIHKGTAWAQAKISLKKVDFFVGGRGRVTAFWRKGNVQNGLFADNSLGADTARVFPTYGVKAGVTYKINGRNYVFANGMYQTKAPYFRYTYVGPRMRNQILDSNTDNLISSNYSIEAGYMLRSPRIKARVVGYYTRYMNEFFQRSFYLDVVTVPDAGGAFVNYIMTGIDKQHMGLELSGKYTFNNGISISSAIAVGEYIYTKRPEARFYVDSDPTTEVDKRTIYLKNFYVPNTPQMAYNLGVSYRSKKYWRLSINFNYFHRSFADVNPDRRTTNAVSYGQDIDFQQQAVEPGSQLWQDILYQEELPGRFMCNLFFSKSWKIKDFFIYLNIGVSNVFHTTDLKTTGFEQFRFDYQNKNVDKFPTKYYHAYGTNFMLQLAFRM